MKIQQDFEPSTSSPADSLVQDVQLSLDIWVAIQRGNSPVSDGNADMIEAILADLGEVVFSDPGIPMVHQRGRRSVLAEGLSVGVLVDDCHARGPWLKDGGSDPWLENEPAAQVHATDYVVVVVEGHITLAEAAVDWLVRLLEQGSRVTYKVRGADCTVPKQEMARVERWRKLLLNMVVIAGFLFYSGNACIWFIRVE